MSRMYYLDPQNSWIYIPVAVVCNALSLSAVVCFMDYLPYIPQQA